MSARSTLRLDLPAGHRLGPGKIDLLEAIRRTGSIAAAGREFGMSYRRAWLLIAELNAMAGAPVLTAQGGGRNGGGAALTPLGQEIITLYRRAEERAFTAAGAEVAALTALLPLG